MKKIIFTILLFVVCLSISGQQISRSNNRYRGNDALDKKQVTVISDQASTYCISTSVARNMRRSLM